MKEKESILATDNLQKLIDGNKRYVASKPLHPNQNTERRNEIAKMQNPLAIILSCSDSRVPPEIIFDQGLGDLFVIRNAGNVLNDEVIGSIEYAVEHLNVPLIVVMAHKRCGAVTAATKDILTNTHIDSIIKAIKPAVDEAKNMQGDIVENATKLNLKIIIDKLKTSKPVLEEFLKEGKLSIIGAFYDLDSGCVEFLFYSSNKLCTC